MTTDPHALRQAVIDKHRAYLKRECSYDAVLAAASAYADAIAQWQKDRGRRPRRPNAAALIRAVT